MCIRDRYDFIGKIDYEPFKTYYNRSGIADPRYLPQYIYSYFLRPNTVPKAYMIPFQNKAYLPCFLPAAKQPEMIVRKVEGNYYNSSFEHITREEAVRLSLAALEDGEIVVKPSGKAGGKGVEFFAEATAAQLHELLSLIHISLMLMYKADFDGHAIPARQNPSHGSSWTG